MASLMNSKRVLLVEDDIVSRNLTEIILKKHGITVISASNGIEAVEHYKRDKFDLILMDISMPDLDGYSVTAMIRAEETGKSIRVPIVAVTANALKEDRERFLEAGMDDYICKPLNLDEFDIMVQKWLGQSV